jgi:hypothetical protein
MTQPVSTLAAGRTISSGQTLRSPAGKPSRIRTRRGGAGWVDQLVTHAGAPVTPDGP